MDIVYILDRSGSMGPIWDDAFGSLNEFVKEQIADGGENDKFTLIVFDTEYTKVCDRMRLGDIEKITDDDIKPRGMTALLDAIGKTINDFTGKKKVSICIMTDGHENASKEFSREDVSALIKKAEKNYGWNIDFAGVGIDAFTVYSDLGFSKMTSHDKSKKGLRGMTQVYTASVSGYRTGS